MNSPDPNAALVAQLRQTLPAIGLRPLDDFPTGTPAYVPRRTGRPGRPPTDRVELLTLVRQNGVLRWSTTPPLATAFPTMRRAGARRAVAGGDIVQQFIFETIAPSQVHQVLAKLDEQLTPARGLRQLTADNQLAPFTGSVARKRLLLFIHGTFSNCDKLISDVLHAPHQSGAKFLNAARKQYDAVLVFDHPTIGVSPALNAFDVAALLKGSPAAVDVICHSRGGLVTRWWFEGFADPRTKLRAILVGSPLAGTSLVAPPRLRSAMEFLTNIGETIQTLSSAASAVPFFALASTVMAVLNSITKFASSTPLVDAAIALIPGLNAQSRIGNNAELIRLRQNTGSAKIEYFAVKANFEPKSAGWEFWRLFVKPHQRLADWATDLVFEADNDLVVDTSSMAELADTNQVTPDRILDFKTTDTVHHTNYFQQTKTIEFFRASFGVK